MGEDMQFLWKAYERMLLIRAFEDEALALTRGDDPMIRGSIHCCHGQEAVPVGALAALRSDDRVLATYRGHGWALECGIPADTLMAELCHRRTGPNGGRAGSLMIAARAYRFFGETSIVGAGAPMACGLALSAREAGSDRIAAVTFGDGAMSQGAVHEAFVLAATEKLPVLFLCENNGWAEMTPTPAASMARRAESYGLMTYSTDGCDVLQVRNVVGEAAHKARRGGGPAFVEFQTVRLRGHYSGDIEHYRSAADKKAAEMRDPLALTRARLLQVGADQSELDSLQEAAAATVATAVQSALEAPLPDEASLCEHVFGATPGRRARPADASAEQLTFGQAVNRALHQIMEERPEAILLGEDVGRAGGIFGLTRGLHKKFGARRVLDAPIAESAILGCAVGAAMDGLRPIAEIMFADFLLVALDQLVNQAANTRYISCGTAGSPVVVRTQQGVTPGSCAQHSQCLEALLAHIPGLRVGVPGTPQDAYAMLRAAVDGPDPCVIIEARALYTRMGEVLVGGPVEATAGAKLLRGGSDVGIVTWGTMVSTALDAAERLAADGIDAAVLNLRWLCPLDEHALAEVTKRCGRILVVHEANRTGGFGAEVAARIGEHCAEWLKAPVRRLGAPDIRMPAAPNLQRLAIPSAERVAEVVQSMITSREAP